MPKNSRRRLSRESARCAEIIRHGLFLWAIRQNGPAHEFLFGRLNVILRVARARAWVSVGVNRSCGRLVVCGEVVRRRLVLVLRWHKNIFKYRYWRGFVHRLVARLRLDGNIQHVVKIIPDAGGVYVAIIESLAAQRLTAAARKRQPSRLPFAVAVESLIHSDFNDCRATGAYDAGGVGLVLELTLRTRNFHITHFYFLWPTGHKLQSPETRRPSRQSFIAIIHQPS